MSRGDDRRLRAQQYGSGSNLNARAGIHQRFSTNPYGWQRWVFDRLLQIGGRDILEVGCGVGAVWATNADRVPVGWRLTLTDFSAGMIGESRQALAGRRVACRFAVCDARWQPFVDDSFDCVMANHMLYHVPDRRAAFREVARVLRHGGAFVAATNGAGHLAELDAIAHRHGFAMNALSSAPFTLENGAEQLREVFTDVVCERYEDSLRVTEAEPLVAYVLSTAQPDDVDAAATTALRAQVEQMLRCDGVIHITKSVGLFRSG